MNELIFNNYHSISFIGMGKNAGKTTALNYFVGKAKGKYSLGLTSVGLDGESIDKVTETSKPRIYVTKGTLIATAEGCLKDCDTTKEILDVVPIHTPLGSIVVFRSLSDGYIEIAGPSTKSGLRVIVDLLKEKGADKVFVDGALSRKSLACPSVTDATIFSTGAAVSYDIIELSKKTLHQYAMLSIPVLNDVKLRNLIHSSSEKLIHINSNDEVVAFDIMTALGADERYFNILGKDTKLLYIEGALTDKVANRIIENTPVDSDYILLIEDGSKAFMTEKIANRLLLKGIHLKSLEKITVAGITINPYSPGGNSINDHDLIKILSSKLPVPVWNIKEVENHEIFR